MITDTQMRAKPSSTDVWLRHPFQRGAGVFEARITPAGEKLFYFRYTNPAGRRSRYLIGAYHPKGEGGLTLAEAAEQAQRLSKLYREGAKDLHGYFAQQAQDAADQARREREALAEQERQESEARRQAELEQSRRATMRQLFERWAAVDLTPRVGADGKRIGRKDGGEYTRQQFERHVFPFVGDVAVEDVRRADLMAVFDRQVAAGKLRTANVLFTDLKQMLRFALHRELVQVNVLDGLEKRHVGGGETERERVLSVQELEQLAQGLPTAGMCKRSELAVWAILGTACRVSELMQAQWRDVDLDACTWRIPPEHSKNEREHVIHLSAFVLDKFRQLHALREVQADGTLRPWVFPNKAGNDHVCPKSFAKQVADRQKPDADARLSRRSRNVDALKLPGGRWTPHDLRRTAATMMGHMGVSNDVVDECLNHMIQSRVTRIYLRDRRLAEQARAFDLLGVRLQAITTGEAQQARVIPLPVRAA